MNLFEQCFQLHLKLFILSALVELADEMTACLEDIRAEA